MTAPKVFGREMDRVYGGYSLRVGLFSFHVQEQGFPSIHSGSSSGRPAEDIIPTEEDKCNGYKRQTEWLESTARRIMRECFEMAGEMVAGSGLNQVGPVRFKDD